MSKEKKSTPEENIEVLKGVIEDLEKGWSDAQRIENNDVREGTLKMIEERRVELLQKLARLELKTQFGGATDLSSLPDIEAYNPEKTMGTLASKYKNLIDELNHQLEVLKVEKLTASNPKLTEREIDKVERELRLYQQAIELLYPGNKTRQ